MKKVLISIFFIMSVLALSQEFDKVEGSINQSSSNENSTSVEENLGEESDGNISEELENNRKIAEYRPSILREIDAQIKSANNGNIGGLIKRYNIELDKYLESVSYDSNRIFFLANEYVLLNDYSRANMIFLKDNKDIKNIFGAATTYRFMGQNQNAIDKYDQVIFNNSSFAEAYLGRGLAYRNMDKYEEAEKDLKNYLALTSSHEAYVALADVYFKLGKNKEAYNIANQGLAKYGGSKILKTLSSNILKNKID